MENSTQSVHKNRAKLGRALLEFEGRILNGIRLDIDKSSGNPSRYVYRFVKVADETAAAKASGEPEKPAETAEPPAKPDEPPEIAAAESCNHVTICNPPESDEPPEIALESCNHVTICNPPAARYSIEKNTSYNEHVCVCDKNVIGYGGSGGLQGVTWLQAPYLALDLETYSGGNKAVNTTKARSTGGALRPWTGEIRLLTITDAEGGLRRFDLMSAPVLPPEVISAISEKPLIIHNGSFDLLFLAHKLGVHPPGVFCTLTASRLLSGSRLVKHDLGAVLERYLGVKLAKEYGASDWGAARLSFEQLEYAEDDVRYLHRLKGVLMTKLEKAGLSQVFNLESALIPVVVGIEEQGFAVDAQKMRGLLALVEARQGVLQEALRTKFGIPALNPGSSQQVVKAFQSIGETIPNANEETLIALDHEYAPMVLEYHKVARRVGTITGLLKHVQTDGRIHAQFKPLGTDTGRFSSSKPNLQNIDRGELRTCFIPSASDRRLIVADYSQIELRIGAIFAKDAAMLDAFRAGEDLHRKTAAGVLSKTVEEVTKADRQLAKAINFGFLYGQQAEGFRGYAKTKYGVTVSSKDAVKFRSKFFAQRPGLNRWHREAWNKAPRVSQAQTILGRILLPRGNTDWGKFEMLTNYVVQGSAADVLKVAMVKLRYRFPDLIIVATVHDELVFDVPADGAEALRELIRLTMIDAFSEVFGDIIPMEVEAKVCFNWGEKD